MVLGQTNRANIFLVFEIWLALCIDLRKTRHYLDWFFPFKSNNVYYLVGWKIYKLYTIMPWLVSFVKKVAQAKDNTVRNTYQNLHLKINNTRRSKDTGHGQQRYVNSQFKDLHHICIFHPISAIDILTFPFPLYSSYSHTIQKTTIYINQ